MLSHKRWGQGKLPLQRCCICPGCTHFLEKPMRMLLRTFWMKAAMDSHGDR